MSFGLDLWGFHGTPETLRDNREVHVFGLRTHGTWRQVCDFSTLEKRWLTSFSFFKIKRDLYTLCKHEFILK